MSVLNNNSSITAVGDVKQPVSDTAVSQSTSSQPQAAAKSGSAAKLGATLPREIGGREGLEPTRYGDWEKSGRCIDF